MSPVDEPEPAESEPVRPLPIDSPDTVEFLPPAMSTTWKIAMVTVAVSAVMAFTAIFQTLYGYVIDGPGGGGSVVVTLWKISSPGGSAGSGEPPEYKYPLLFGAVALLASAVILIISVERPSMRAVGRTLTLMATAFFAGVAWMVCTDVVHATKQFDSFKRDAQLDVVFTVGDAVWFSVIAGVLAIVSSVLVLTRPISPPREAGPMIYQLVPDEEPERPSDENP